jgi:hypothetical protein
VLVDGDSIGSIAYIYMVLSFFDKQIDQQTINVLTATTGHNSKDKNSDMWSFDPACAILVAA